MTLSRREKTVKLNKYLMQFTSPFHPIIPTLSLAERKKSTQPEQFAFLSLMHNLYLVIITVDYD